eukprot:14913409-Alexandrium_andersonii.AAC.1
MRALRHRGNCRSGRTVGYPFRRAAAVVGRSLRPPARVAGGDRPTGRGGRRAWPSGRGPQGRGVARCV